MCSFEKSSLFATLVSKFLKARYVWQSSYSKRFWIGFITKLRTKYTLDIKKITYFMRHQNKKEIAARENYSISLILKLSLHKTRKISK